MKKRSKGRSSEGNRIQIGARVSPRIKAMLDESAQESGRSVSQEAEWRIEATYRSNNLLTDTLCLRYGERLGAILRIVGDAAAQALRYVPNETPEDVEAWTQSPYAFNQVKLAINEALTHSQPKGEIVVPRARHEMVQQYADQLGALAARRILQDVVDPPEIDAPAQRLSAELKPYLGPVFDRIDASLAKSKAKK